MIGAAAAFAALRRSRWMLVCMLLARALAAGKPAAAAQPALVLAEGLDQPLFLTAPDGDSRLFVVERAGRIRLVEGGVLLPEPFLDLSAKVDTEREGGMTGLAFPPDYAATGHFYVYYTKGIPDVEDRMMESVVASFQAIGPPGSARKADPASEQVIFSQVAAEHDPPRRHHRHPRWLALPRARRRRGLAAGRRRLRSGRSGATRRCRVRQDAAAGSLDSESQHRELAGVGEGVPQPFSIQLRPHDG